MARLQAGPARPCSAGPSAERRPIGVVGNFNADLVLGPVSRLPTWDEELAAEAGALRTAGTAGYFALAARALGLEPRIVSTIGDDGVGRLLVADLRARGIPTEGLTVLEGEATPVSAVVVGPEGRRSIVSAVGAHRRMDLGAYRSRVGFLADCAEVFICGSYLLPALGPAEVVEVAWDARRRGQVVAFDPSWDPAGWPESTRRATLDLLAAVDVYLPNEAELRCLTGTPTWEDGLRRLTGAGPEIVTKLGSGGAAAFGGRGGPPAETVRVPALAVEVVDTIGAGDCFDAAYLWARRQGWPVGRRLAFANAFAGLVVSRMDPEAYPTLEEVATTGLAAYKSSV